MPRCLIIVAKAPIAGQVKTRLSAGVGAERAVELYRCFLEDTIELAGQIARCRTAFSFWPPAAGPHFAALCPGALLLPQAGAGFGERLLSAFTQAAAEGYDEMVLIASDNPGLPAAAVERAFAALADAPAVLGPAEDGGYYLIGMREPQPALLLGDIAWSTERVAAQTYAAAAAAGIELATAPTWYDIDTAADLRRLHADLRAGRAHAPATLAALDRLMAGSGESAA